MPSFCNPKMDQYFHHWHKVQSALELESLSTGSRKDTYWFYHLLTVLPSPYFVGTKDETVSARVLMTINLSHFSEYVKYSHMQCVKPHLTKPFFSFLNPISCLNSCKKYLHSETGIVSTMRMCDSLYGKR